MKSQSTCNLLKGKLKNKQMHCTDNKMNQFADLWEDHPGQPTTVVKEEGKKKKKGGGKTVSSVYLVSLVELMT